jgi:1-deoxy-D-xylulose-5-phosphate reductoisomerase
LPTRIAILGSTGSIGTNALEVASHLRDRFDIFALSTHNRVNQLIEQAQRFKPKVVAVTNVEPSSSQRAALEATGAKLLVGHHALELIARMDEVDLVLLAVVGASGVQAAIATVDAGKQLALANKESLVVAGSVLMPLAKQKGITIRPVDSEHSAMFQCMAGGRRDEISRVFLTASGGPFREWSVEQMHKATVDEALKHPTWTMGRKVTIDSATMFNKSLELIEACWLFDLPPQQIEIVIHPESIVHSMVEFADGSTLAQLSPPDMKTPIQYAMCFPDRPSGIGRRMDFSQKQSWRFEPVDQTKFVSIALGYEVATKKGTSGAVFNAANEVAVDALCDGRIRVGDVAQIVKDTLMKHQLIQQPTLDDLMSADRWARDAANRRVERMMR